MLSIVDIVLNHTANNSDWIQDHPEACYNTDQVPRLWPAWLVDDEISKMSDEYIKGNLSWSNSAPYLKSEADLERVINEMRRRLTNLNLSEYFICDFSPKLILDQLPKLKGVEIDDYKTNIFPGLKT